MTYITISASRGRTYGRFAGVQRCWSSGELLFVRGVDGTVHAFPWPWVVEYTADL